MDLTVRGIADEHRYGIVLVLILTSLVFQLAAPEAGWARLVTIALQGATLLAALIAARARPAVRHVATLVVTGAVVGYLAALIGFGHIGSPAARAVTVLLAAIAPAMIAVGLVRDFRESQTITVRTMFGVLCIYLLLGMLFSVVFGLVDDASSEFFAQDIDATTSDFLYFSFATMTTTGYGDLVAATNLARSLAIAEALIGQIYMVTVVAVIVGNLGRRRRA